MVIWFAMVIGIGVSAIGVIMQVSVYVTGVGIRWMNFLMPKDLAFSCGWTTAYPFKLQPKKWWNTLKQFVGKRQQII